MLVQRMVTKEEAQEVKKELKSDIASLKKDVVQIKSDTTDLKQGQKTILTMVELMYAQMKGWATIPERVARLEAEVFRLKTRQ